LWKFWISSLVNCASSINIAKAGKLGFYVPIWTPLSWIPFLVEMTNHHSITVHQTVCEMHVN
jgi:hypothetical protein